MTADASPADRPAPKRQSWLRALPVLVLVIAVLAQAVLMATVNVDRQSGSGFAMFSSVDFAGSRGVTVLGADDDQFFRVSLPASFDDQLDDLRYAPTNAGAASLARDLIDQRWTHQDGTMTLSADGVTFERIVVEVRGLRSDGRELSSVRLAQGVAS